MGMVCIKFCVGLQFLSSFIQLLLVFLIRSDILQIYTPYIRVYILEI